MNRAGGVILDVDGTLVDSEELGTRVLVELAAQHGLALPLKQTNLQFRGWKLHDCLAQIEQWLGHPLPPGTDVQVRQRTAEVFRRQLKAMPGALELVRGLKLPMCVASSGPREKIELTLGLTGLLPYFEGRIFSGYELNTWKPAPDLFLHAARALGVAPADCVVVEDSPVGVQAGLAAGMRVYAYQPGEVDPNLPKDVPLLRHLPDLLGLLAA